MSLHDVSRTLRSRSPLAGAAGVVILLHGRGASAEDIAGLADILPHQDVAFLAPDATQGTWYPQRFFMPLAMNEPWLSSALKVVDSLVQEAKNAGIPERRIGLAGFSQGGCLALEYLVRNPAPLGFVAGLSSALIGPAGTVRPPVALDGVPVLVACAERDPHIPLEFVESSVSTLQGYGAVVARQIFPGGDHTVFQEEIDWITDRMRGWVLPAASEGV